MDTTTYLAKLLSIKSGPGGIPFITNKYLDVIQNNLVVDRPELIFHIASSANEPVIIKYLLDRYSLDPNLVSVSTNVSHSPYMNTMMFECYDVINVFLERHLFPDNWYLMFLFAKIYNGTENLVETIEKYGDHISLKLEEVERLKTMYEDYPKIMEFLHGRRRIRYLE